jgi:menaquinone-dependent protoporphyrinogen oxidase
MGKRILVTYASKYGSTAQIADKISQVLQSEGLAVDEQPVDQSGDPSKYDAVVFGSAVYAGSWRKEATSWLSQYATQLSHRPTWIFSSGPTGEGDAEGLMDGWRFPEKMKAVIESIKPQSITCFHGEIDTDKLNFGEKLIVKGVKAPVGDYRLWHQISSWSAGIASALNGGGG